MKRSRTAREHGEDEMQSSREDWAKQRGGRIDIDRELTSPLDADERIDEAIAESFPASDPPSWNGGIDPVNEPGER
ncbi:MAG TPA: hypothetical protein VMS56_15335 [Thermoanaerobaculia bacterium]|nr:hypothetical protein [Thermoanaerobaculia bacterium]